MLGPLPDGPQHINWLIWVEALNRSTGAVEASGIWSGGISRTLTVEGQSRVYHGAGNIIDLSEISFMAKTTSIQPQTIVLNGLTPEVEAMIRGYEAKQAKIQIHRWVHPPKIRTGGSIERAIKGIIDEIDFKRGASGVGESPETLQATITVMTAARRGTKTLALKRSDATHKTAFPNDMGRRYSSSTAKVVWMGEVKDPFKSRRGLDPNETGRM